MLELRSITHTLSRDGEDLDLIHRATVRVPPGHFMAIVGPSGCGKTTLLKLIAGLMHETDGQIHWQGRDLAEEGDLEPQELGYVPQFSIAYDHLTVEESIDCTVRLRLAAEPDLDMDEIADSVMEQTGLSAIRDRRVKVLSGGQKRRLGLAMELVCNPTLLLCDEVTSGLDPKSEREITEVLHSLSRSNPKRVVVNVTHSLGNLDLYDSVLVMSEGRVAYHGPPRAMAHYFSVETTEEIYPRLGNRPADNWFASWDKNRDTYYEAFGFTVDGRLVGTSEKAAAKTTPEKPTEPEPDSGAEPRKESLTSRAQADDTGTDSTDPDAPAKGTDSQPLGRDKDERRRKRRGDDDQDDDEDEYFDDLPASPGLLTQVSVLLGRRWTIFRRDRTQVILHLAMLLGFPVLVVIFALDGIEPLKALSARADDNLILEQQRRFEQLLEQIKIGGLVSGLIMFQVILLTLMGSNNSAREIAAERLILEKEKLGGLRPMAYVLSKIAFLTPLVLLQAVWMTMFVDVVCGGLPGPLGLRLMLLILVTGAMTAICLGISAIMRTPEQATLLSIYLVGFQLPLSGAVLALPGTIESVVQPFIAAFWSWSGALTSMRTSDGQFYDAVKQVTDTTLVEPNTAVFLLSAHIVIGVLLAWLGARRAQWD